jgi:hypothetical protein
MLQKSHRDSAESSVLLIASSAALNKLRSLPSIKLHCSEGNCGQARLLYSGLFFRPLEWRNWQTHGTQNPAHFTVHVGSTPTSSTNKHGS